MKILYASTEAEPYAKSGGLGDVAGSLPKALNGLGADARVIMPLYKSIKRRFAGSLEFVRQLTVDLSWRKQYCGLFSVEEHGVVFYFIDNEQYFGRDAYYGYYDDGERFAFFSKAVVEVVKVLDFKPDIMHCNEWQTGLIPVYLKSVYSQDPFFAEMKTVFTIHNVEYQGRFDLSIGQDVFGLSEEQIALVEFKNMINLMKGAIVCCDRLTTVSPTYAKELEDPFFAHDLDGVVREFDYKFSGIINGIDTEKFNPETDKLLPVNYGNANIDKKTANKTALQQQLNLETDPTIPMIGMVGRLVAHKGLDLVKYCFSEIMSEKVQFVILGTGDEEYKHFFTHKACEYSGRVAASIHFSPELANKIYAASDFFLMPSRSEPCGLSQMIALRYGTIPIVRETGGLRDSVTAYDPVKKTGNGVTFVDYQSSEMLDAIRRGLYYYQKKELWKPLVDNAFKSDFSWGRSAEAYMSLYKELL